MENITIKPEVYEEIMFHVNKSNVEVSGLGRVERLSDGTPIVTKVYLLEQENSSVTTDIDPDAVAKIQYQSREDKGDLNFWWHSHVNMGVFWSGTDRDTIEEFGENGYILATVFNKKSEMRSAYYQGGKGFHPSVFIDNIKTEVKYTPTETEVERWEKEHDEKCKTAKVIAGSWQSKNWSGGDMNGFGDWTYGDEWDPVTQSWSKPNQKKILTDATYTGADLDEIINDVIAHVEVGLKFSELSSDDKKVWWDFYELSNGSPPNTSLVKDFYNGSLLDLKGVIDDIEELEEQYRVSLISVNEIAVLGAIDESRISSTTK